jgi:alanine dehydrogenase
MIIGVPKEIKADEYRVALTPAGAEMLVSAGHTVRIEKGAGFGSGFADDAYVSSGAEIVDAAADVWAGADMIMKVKEPIAKEWPLMKSGQVIFTYFHFAASEELTRAVIDSGAIAIAYETVELSSGELPLLTPMSEIAGRMAVQEGAKYLERPQGGLGVLLGGVPGVLPGKVLILGGGIVGINAAKVAAGLGARVCIMDIDLARLRYLDDVMPANVHTLFSTRSAIRQQVRDADVIIGAVLVTGAKAPKLITEDDLSLMRAGTVIVDVAVDQGGCVETIRPTTHHDPVYTVDGVMHYGVANMPGGVPRSSTFALTNATLPYALQLASKGWKRACADIAALEKGVNVVTGKVTHEAVAGAFGLDYVSVREAIASGPKMA